MKWSINSKKISAAFLLGTLLLSGCGSENVPLSYGSLDNNPDYSLEDLKQQTTIPLFARELCAAASDVTQKSSVSTAALNSACVYDLSGKKVLYSYNANEHLSPASLTKLMTVLLAFENCPDLDQKISVGDVTIKENGAQLFGLKEGDRLSIRDLLYITLLPSANDAALALAIYIAGSEEAFSDMMNERALKMGATNTHFVNPHGLTAEGHYTCAYDLYLMFNELLKYPEFTEIIQTASKTIEYTSADGSLNSKDAKTTNQYLKGGIDTPRTVSVIGGKTGSTQAAGKCMIVYATSGSGKPYIVVVMGAEDVDSLYKTINRLCDDVI